MENIDLTTASLALLFVIGAVNIIGIFKPGMDSRVKLAISLVVAFGVSFVPPELGNVILDHLKTAIETAIAGSGLYKLTQVVGNKVNQ